jgi:pimeloyl-ACP methyl ester carboxylesterase
MCRRYGCVSGVLALVLFTASLVGCAAEGDDDPTLDEAANGGGGGHGGGHGAPNPVIWVHGCPPPFATHDQVSHFTDGQRAFFQAQGYPADRLVSFVFSGAQCGSNLAFAAQLASLVSNVRATTHASKVDIVAHSMGALSARIYLALGGYRYVDHFVSISGANHGSLAAEPGVALQAMLGAPAYEGMKEMFPPYACLHQTSGGAFDVQTLVNGCLTATGRTMYVDETPDSSHVDYLSIRNSIDEEIVPSESGCLNQHFQNDCSDHINVQVTVPPAPGPGPCGPDGCPAHVAILFDQGVTQTVYDHITDDGHH